MTRRILRDIEKSIAKKSRKNQKLFWNYVRGKMKTKSGIPQLKVPGKMVDGKPAMTENDKEKAEVLSKQFSNVFTDEPEGDTPTLPDRDYQSILDDIEITEEIIKKKLEKLNVTKSPGPDNIHPRVLKELAACLAKPLLIIFKTSLRTGRLPREWKLAKVSAVFKKGAKKDCNNYRPISLTCIICKVMESIIRDAIVDHMKTNKLFSKMQYGFINGRSTMLQLLKVIDEWTEALDRGGQVDIIYMDFMKAL